MQILFNKYFAKHSIHLKSPNNNYHQIPVDLVEKLLNLIANPHLQCTLYMYSMPIINSMDNIGEIRWIMEQQVHSLTTRHVQYVKKTANLYILQASTIP